MQKIRKNNRTRAREIFKEYLEKKGLSGKTRDKLINLQETYPNVFKPEMEFLIDNTEHLFLTHPRQFQVIIKYLARINKEIKYALDGLSLNSPEQKLALKIKKIFSNNYVNFVSNETYYKKMIIALDLKTCPYCNISELNPEEISGNLHIHLDHFYHKSLYPYFSMSFYNLIPACPICNSKFKRDTDVFKKEHLNPYIEGFDDACKFMCNIIYPDIFNSKNSFKIKPDYNANSSLIERAKNNDETFNITERYNKEFNFIQRMLLLNRNYNKAALENISKFLEVSGFEGDFSQENLSNLAFKDFIIDKSDLNAKPFSKLIKDLNSAINIS